MTEELTSHPLTTGEKTRQQLTETPLKGNSPSVRRAFENK